MIKTISPNERMFNGNEGQYFQVALSAANVVANAISSAGRTAESIQSILDFGCGHGRVMRALRAEFPKAKIVACDLIPDAVDFCVSTFDAEPLYGSENIFDIKVGKKKFDLIWVGSVFTHLPEWKWLEFLGFFKSILNDGGVLVFTVHGRTAIWMMKKFGLAGAAASNEELTQIENRLQQGDYVFKSYGKKHHKALLDQGVYVEQDDYGLSFVSIPWIGTLLNRFPEYFLLGFNEGGWASNHDVVALKYRKGGSPS